MRVNSGLKRGSWYGSRPSFWEGESRGSNPRPEVCPGGAREGNVSGSIGPGRHLGQPFAKVVRKIGKSLNYNLGGAVEAADDLQDLPAIRNALPAHDNEFAREFPRNVMVEVAQRALGLVNALYCADCRSLRLLFHIDSSPSIVHCRCKKI